MERDSKAGLRRALLRARTPKKKNRFL